ncbi:unnamed protein product, partial [Prorocentrum cordatum]
DMTNAFGSSGWSELEITIAHSTSEENRALCQQRYENSMVELTAEEGPLLVKPFQGGVMGGPFTVAAFLGTFSRATLQWAYQWSRSDSMSRFLVAKWQDFQSGLSLLIYADVVNKTAVASDEMALGDLVGKVHEMDEIFDSVLQPFGYVQNLRKQEFLTYFASQGNRARQMVRKGISGIQGTIKDRVRYLGPHIRVRDSSHQEVTRRCSAARTAFYRVGGIWSLAIPFKLRKLLLVGNVQNALLSGLEAFVLSKAAPPWLSQMTHDLECAAGVVDSEAIDVLLHDMNAFIIKEKMEDFCMLDMAVLRASRFPIAV